MRLNIKGHAGGIVATVLLTIGLAVMGWLMVHYESDMLYRAQEQSLFMHGSYFLAESLKLPGGLMTWAAAYLTQYFYHPAQGVMILVGLWALIMLAMQRATRLPAMLMPLLLIVPAALMTTIVQNGYFIFYVKLQGYFFAATLGMLFVALAMWLGAIRKTPPQPSPTGEGDLSSPSSLTAKANRSTPSPVGEGWGGVFRVGFMLLVCAVGYPLCGAYGLLATACLGVMMLCREGSSWPWRITGIALAAALIGVVPLIYYNVYTSVAQSELWKAALPCLQSGGHIFYTFDYAYYVLPAAPIIYIVCSALTTPPQPSPTREGAGQSELAVETLNGKANKTTPSHVGEGWGGVAISALVLILCSFGVKQMWYHDDLFNREMRMYACADRNDWNGVLQEARGGFEFVPTRLMVMYKNLAMWKLGRSGEEMFHYRDGGTAPRVQPTHYVNDKGERNDTVPFRVRLPQVGGKLMYYHYGKANYSYRWGMEDAVEFGWRIENLKYMAKCCLLNEEWNLARRYLEMLRRTDFHREWADHYAEFLHKPERIKEDEELGPIHRLMCYNNRLDGDESMVELYIMRTFANGGSDQPEFQELTLINAMLTQDIDLFWPRFMMYAHMHPGMEHMPTHYQEAAYLYGHLENKVNISNMPFDESVKRSYEAFMNYNQQCGPIPESEKARLFYPNFGHTFYYFYFFSRNLQTY